MFATGKDLSFVSSRELRSGRIEIGSEGGGRRTARRGYKGLLTAEDPCRSLIIQLVMLLFVLLPLHRELICSSAVAVSSKDHFSAMRSRWRVKVEAKDRERRLTGKPAEIGRDN